MERKNILIIIIVIGIIGATIPILYHTGFMVDGETGLKEDLEAMDIESLELSLRDENYNIELDIWIRGFDTERIDYRLEALIEGLIPVTQVYNYDRETLYTVSPDEDLDITDLFRSDPETGIDREDFIFEKEENLTIEKLVEEKLDLLKLLIAFGFWAEEHGTGEHELEVEDGVLIVNIRRKNEKLPDELFKLEPPENLE